MKINLEEIFNEDYLYFYSSRLGDKAAETAVTQISEILRLPIDATILDVGCGEGRLSRGLASRGYSVVGMDMNEFMIQRARESSENTGIPCKFVLADARDMMLETNFDGAFSWFTSFGYFSDSENLKILENICGHLKEDGKFVIEVVNKDFLIKNFKDTLVSERENHFMIDRLTYDAHNGRVITQRTILRHGIRREEFFVRLFAYPELRDWLLRAGFRSVELANKNPNEFPQCLSRLVVCAIK